ncbi:MAG: ABC transporter permease subunit [Fusicatenibacter saccharivorans]
MDGERLSTFAAISGIDPSLYEAAAIDGAGKWKQAINITLPCIVPTIIIQFILSSSNILNAGFDQIFMLYTSHVYDVADIIDTYVYRMGIINNDYSFSTAAGMFKSVVALILDSRSISRSCQREPAAKVCSKRERKE